MISRQGAGTAPIPPPDERIEWSASPNGRVRFVGDDNTGREVSVLGLAPGDVTLTANVRGYAGPPPLVRARVMPRTTVPVYAWIVCGTNGVPAVEESDLRGKFPEINRIWDQVGITWQLAEVNFVTNQAWVRIRDDETRTNLFSQICSFGTAPGGVELYCVGIIDEAGGLTNTNGCVVQGDSAPVVYAHEFGHLCGLKDIYESRPRKTGLVVTGSVEILKSFPSASFFTETNNQQQNHEINVFAIVCRNISRLGPRFRAH